MSLYKTYYVEWTIKFATYLGYLKCQINFYFNMENCNFKMFFFRYFTC